MLEPRTPIALASLPEDVLAPLVAILNRAIRTKNRAIRTKAAAGPVDRERLESDLLSVFHAVGVAHDGSVEGALWHELALAEPPTDHKALALGYRRMAEADTPLDPEICTPELRPGLQRRIRRRWPARTSIAAGDWAALKPAEQDAIRAMAQDLAAWHGGNVVRRGRPRKNDLDTLLDQVADVFGRHGGLETNLDELPDCEESRFIRFAATALALAPFYDPSEVTRTALARRWKRAKVAGEEPAA